MTLRSHEARKQFYIVRHGVTENPGVLLGQFDMALSAEGARQAQHIAGELAAERIERVVSSTLIRARETADWIARRFGLQFETDERLNEISYGHWDGLRWEQIEQIDPTVASQKLKDWWSATPSGGEQAGAFARRVEQAWVSLLEHPATTTVVVAHEAVNAVLVELSRRRPGCENNDWQPDWARVSSFRQQRGAYCKLTVETE
jgi:alpha-ribazole phosphatase